MEWDQIAFRWAAMAQRLRCDRTEYLRTVSGPQDTRRKETTLGEGAPVEIVPKRIVSPLELTSHK